jgi:hypothetical protein
MGAKMADNVATLSSRRAAKEVAARVSRLRPDRKGKAIIAGHFEQDTSFALHEAVGILGRQMRMRITIQDALGMALRLWFLKAGLGVPDELKELPRLPCRSAGAKSRASNPAAG